MILFVEKNCPFCKEFEEIPGLTIAELSADGKSLNIKGEIVPNPIFVTRIPLLWDNGEFYIGRDVIKEKLSGTRIKCAV